MKKSKLMQLIESIVDEEIKKSEIPKYEKLFFLAKDTSGERFNEYDDLIKNEFNGWLQPHIEDALESSSTIDEFMDLVSRFELNDQINEDSEKQSNSDKLATEIKSIISKIDDSMSYKDFAKGIAKVLKDDYGTHNYQPFVKVLISTLRGEK